MRIVYFTHSLRSCWNHGNAHFLRGILRDLIRRGHTVAVYETAGSWSLDNLVRDHGLAGLQPFVTAYPDLTSRPIDPGSQRDLEQACDDADLVIVHEWNEPVMVAAIGRIRRRCRFALLFHDTHHRAVSDPAAIRAFDLRDFDGILAFGEALSEVYRRWGWRDRVFTWHEAADVTVFHPPAEPTERRGLVWIGNWGDGERTGELETFLFRPAQVAGLTLDVYGVRYPEDARALLRRFGAAYHGWIANAAAPGVFAHHLTTVHVPRRFYVERLPGIPTIRMFEALACGLPLVSAPWRDCEGLFRIGSDFLMAGNGDIMIRHLTSLASDSEQREELARNGLETILARHTCAHRVDELLRIFARIAPAERVAMEAVA